jgi:hypothetical protein
VDRPVTSALDPRSRPRAGSCRPRPAVPRSSVGWRAAVSTSRRTAFAGVTPLHVACGLGTVGGNQLSAAQGGVSPLVRLGAGLCSGTGLAGERRAPGG